MKRIVKKIYLRIVQQKYRLTIHTIIAFFITFYLKGKRRRQYILLNRNVRLYAKRTGILLSSNTTGITPAHSYPADTLKALDSMILNKLQLLQFGITFREAKFLILSSPPYGVGSFIDTLSKGLAYSYLYNRTLLLNKSHMRYDFCYEPISIHYLKDVNEKCLDGSVKFNLSQQKEKFVHPIYWQAINPPVLSTLLNSVHPLSLPLSTLYIKGLILGSFLKLKQEYKLHIEERKKAIGFKNPIIGVHIRQGDVKTNPRDQHRNFPFQTYSEVIEQIVDKTGIRTVFVTTDSEEVIQQLPKNSGIDFIYDDKEKRYDNNNTGMVLEHPELKKQETMASIKNIHLLAECNYIIGSDSIWFYNSLSLSYFHNKKLNGIQIIKRDKTGYDVKYIEHSITGDDFTSSNSNRE